MTARILGNPLFRLATVDSTNRVAAELATQGVPEGTTVVATTQTGGRGRSDRAWASPPGGLWLTTLLRPAVVVSPVSTLSLMAGVAVAEMVRRLAGGRAPEVAIKWPNDVLANRRKLAGILGQIHSSGAILLGIGVNLNVSPDDLPPEVRPLATSLARETGLSFDETAALETLLDELSAWYEGWLGEGFAPARRRCLELTATVGKSVRVTGPGLDLQGEALDILADGALLVRAGGRDVVVRAGDIFVRAQEDLR